MMSSKLAEVMSRIRRTLQNELPRGYDHAVTKSYRPIAVNLRKTGGDAAAVDGESGLIVSSADDLAAQQANESAAKVITKPMFSTRYIDVPKVVYRPSGLPAFDGLPTREQVQQGIGDCSLVAVLGAVAGHRPEAIAKAILERSDGTFDVTLFHTWSDRHFATVPPATETVTFRVSGDLPYPVRGRTGSPAGAFADTCAWPSLLEKTFAGDDLFWD